MDTAVTPVVIGDHVIVTDATRVAHAALVTAVRRPLAHPPCIDVIYVSTDHDHHHGHIHRLRCVEHRDRVAESWARHWEYWAHA
jgi:hypothetical protein